MGRRDLSYGVVVSTRGLRVHALLEEVIALRLGARRRSTGLCMYELQGCEPFYQWRRGVAYIEFAGPLRPSVMQDFKYIKVGRYW